MQTELCKNGTQSKAQQITNVASVPMRSPFRYPGGKTWFVPEIRRWLTSQRTKPRVFVEPFAGGAIAGLTAAFENLADKVILVELDANIASVWRTILEGDYNQLCRKIIEFNLTFDNAKKVLEENPKSDEDRAFQTVLKNRVAHGGIMAPGAGLIKNGEGGKGISSRWYPETLARRIRDISLFKSRIQFVEADALDFISEHLDETGAVFFVDPPYTAGGKRAGRRLYFHHELCHEDLFGLLATASGDVVLTYDDSEEIKTLAGHHGFDTQLIAMKNTHHAKMTELIIGKELKWLRR